MAPFIKFTADTGTQREKRVIQLINAEFVAMATFDEDAKTLQLALSIPGDNRSVVLNGDEAIAAYRILDALKG